MRPPTAALVLETNNLRAVDGRTDPLAALVDLLKHLGRQSRPLTELAEVVITHDGLDPGAGARLRAAAGVGLRLVPIATDDGYYAAKNRGFAATTADVVVFADADCRPVDGWLEAVLAPFERPDVQVVAGPTRYAGRRRAAALSAIDFVPLRDGRRAGCTLNFYANNVAFRRETFGAFGYQPAPGTYRGHCQVLAMRLRAAGIPIHFAPGAGTVHARPGGARAQARQRLYRGADALDLAPRTLEALAPRTLGRLPGRVLPATVVLGARWGLTLRTIARSRARPTRKLNTAALAAAYSGVDAIGLMLAGLRLTDFGHGDGTSPTERPAPLVSDAREAA